MKKLRAGIIGLGVGEQHIAGYRSHPACEVVALCDMDGQKLSVTRKKYPKMKLTRNAQDILKDPDIDIVSIASYDNAHYAQIMTAIKYNKHLFVEKPLCLHEQDARAIRKALQKKPRLKISSNLILRRSPRFQQLKQMVSKEKMGKLFYLEGDYDYGRLQKLTEGWRGQIPYYSVILGGGVHIVDLLLWLTGDTVTEVATYGNNIASRGSRFRYNDLTASLLKFKSGLVAKVTCNFGCVRPHFHGFNVYGTKATFINDVPDAKLFKTREKGDRGEKIKAAYPGVHKGDLIHSFVDSLVTGRPAAVTKEDVFRAMSVCFAMEKALIAGKPVKVDYI